MTDTVSKKKRSEIMSKVTSKDSKIEVEFRKALWKKGFRYSKNSTKYFGKLDLVLKKYKTVIFIDSCFWHGCKKHCRIPSTKKDYWILKIERNKKRDKEIGRHYKKIGWKIIRIWEHEIKKIKIPITITNGNKNKIIEELAKLDFGEDDLDIYETERLKYLLERIRRKRVLGRNQKISFNIRRKKCLC